MRPFPIRQLSNYLLTGLVCFIASTVAYGQKAPAPNVDNVPVVAVTASEQTVFRSGKKGSREITLDALGRLVSVKNVNTGRVAFLSYTTDSAARPSVVTLKNSASETGTKTYLLSYQDIDALSGTQRVRATSLDGTKAYSPDDGYDWNPMSYDWSSDLEYDPWSQSFGWDLFKTPEERFKCIVDCTRTCEQDNDYAATAICPFYAPAVAILFTVPTGPGAALAGAAAAAACGTTLVWNKGRCPTRCERRCD